MYYDNTHDNEEDNKTTGGRPSSVKILNEDDRSVTSEITFQSATKNNVSRPMQVAQNQEQSVDPSSQRRPSIGNESLLSGARIALTRYYPRRASAADHPNHQVHLSNTNRLPGTATRRLTEPHASSHYSKSSSDHINTIIELKLQVAEQKELIGRLTSDLSHAVSEQKALLTKTKQPAKPLFTMASLAEEKAHSDNSSSLHQQYNELREDMNRMQKSMDLQQEKIDAVESENRRLSKERNSLLQLQRQRDRMSCKLTESSCSSSSSVSHLHEPSGSTGFTASSTDISGLSGCDLISPADLALAVDQRQAEPADTSYLPWSKVKRRFIEPVNSHRQQFNTTPRAFFPR